MERLVKLTVTCLLMTEELNFLDKNLTKAVVASMNKKSFLVLFKMGKSSHQVHNLVMVLHKQVTVPQEDTTKDMVLLKDTEPLKDMVPLNQVTAPQEDMTKDMVLLKDTEPLKVMVLLKDMVLHKDTVRHKDMTKAVTELNQVMELHKVTVLLLEEIMVLVVITKQFASDFLCKHYLIK